MPISVRMGTARTLKKEVVKVEIMMANCFGKNIDMTNAAIVRREIIRLVEDDESKQRAIFLNFIGIDFIDSSAIGVLIYLYHELKKLKDRKIAIKNPNPEIENMLKLGNLDRVFEIFHSNEISPDIITDLGLGIKNEPEHEGKAKIRQLCETRKGLLTNIKDDSREVIRISKELELPPDPVRIDEIIQILTSFKD